MFAVVNCDSRFAFIFNIIQYLYQAIRIVVPVVLIVLATIDVVKVVINADEKTKKDVGSKVVKRLIYAIILFLVPTLISILFKALDGNAPNDYKTNNSSYSTNWKDCFKSIFM